MKPAGLIQADELIALHPHLVVETSVMGDMLDPEDWGVVMSPAVDGVHTHRYMLWRVFDRRLPLLVVVMLNPSVATHLKGDRTVDGLVRRARRFGYGGVLVVNCFAFRARDPGDMKRADDPVGVANDDAIAIAVRGRDALCAWGVHAHHLERDAAVRCLLDANDARRLHLRLCTGGEPEHPLYVPSDTAPTPWCVT